MVIEALTGLMVDVCVDILTEVGIIVVAAVVIALDFVAPVVVVLMDALVMVLAGIILGVLNDVGVDVLTDVKVIVLVAVMTVLEFAIPAPLYAISCCAEFDCWLMALSNFASVLQAQMPSYHV